MSDIPLPGGGTLKLYDSIYTPQQIEAAIGKGPMIKDGTWWLWDVATMKYWDTGYSLAEGLGPGAVTTPMLSDGSVTWPKLSAEARPIRDNLLDNLYFLDPIDQRNGYIILAGTPIYQDASLTQLIGPAATPFPVTAQTATYVEVAEPNNLSTHYYAQPGTSIRGYCMNGYTIDRWLLYIPGGVTCSMALTGEGITFTTTGGAVQLIQRLPLAAVPSGKTITVSLLSADGQLYTITGTNYDTTEGVYLNTTWGWIAFRKWIATDPYREFVITLNPDNPLSLQAAKLELGPNQTLAHQDADGNWVLNKPVFNSDVELAKCQIYQIELCRSSWSSLGIGYANSTTELVVFMPLPVSMRAKPVVGICEGTFTIRGDKTYWEVPLTDVFVDQWSANGVRVRCTYSGADFTVGAFYALEVNDNNKFLLDANL